MTIFRGEHLLGPRRSGGYKVATFECPARTSSEPWISNMLQLFSIQNRFPNMQPRAGGIEDQDAKTIQAMCVLRDEWRDMEALRNGC